MTRSLTRYDDHVGLWGNELRDWLPDAIFDAHVHLGPPEAMGEISAARRREPLATFTGLVWEELSDFYGSLFSGKTISGLIAFGFPLREVDIEAAREIEFESSCSGLILDIVRRSPRIVLNISPIIDEE